MRQSDAKVSYLVGTPKGRLTKLEKELAEKPWQEVRPQLRVKLLPQEGEVYVLAESGARARQGARPCAGANSRPCGNGWARSSSKTSPGTSGWKNWAARGTAPDAPSPDWCPSRRWTLEGKLTFSLDRTRLRTVRRREGRYLLRTNLSADNPELLWRCYMQLVFVEEAFRTLKGDLGLRPILPSANPNGSKRTCSWPSWPIV